MMVSEAESKSFLNYMKSIRQQQKAQEQGNQKANIDFNFEDFEVDANTYGFITADKKNNKSNKQQNKLKTTEITTIDLFEKDDTLKSTKNQSQIKHNEPYTLAKVIKIFFRWLNQ